MKKETYICPTTTIHQVTMPAQPLMHSDFEANAKPHPWQPPTDDETAGTWGDLWADKQWDDNLWER